MYVDEVQIGMKIEVPGQPAEREIIGGIINTARECGAVAHVPNAADHR
jgi:hypothetical protein